MPARSQVGWGLALSLALHAAGIATLSLALPPVHVEPRERPIDFAVMSPPEPEAQEAATLQPMAAEPVQADDAITLELAPPGAAQAAATAVAGPESAATQQETAAAQPGTAPARQEAAAAQRETAPAQQETAPAQQETAQRETAPAQQETAQRETAPAQPEPAAKPSAQPLPEETAATIEVSPPASPTPVTPPPARKPEPPARKRKPPTAAAAVAPKTPAAAPSKDTPREDAHPDGSTLERVLRQIAATTELTQDERRRAMMVVLRNWQEPNSEHSPEELIDALIQNARRARSAPATDAPQR
jgi:hypothetical protein